MVLTSRPAGIGRVILAVACATVFFVRGADAGSYGFGPGLAIATDIPLGQETPVLGPDGSFEIHNDSERPATFVLSVQKPVQAAVLQWEKGFSEIPDPAWCRLEKTEITVPARSIGRVRLFVTIPDKPEHCNRRWMAAVTCEARTAHKGTGVSFRLAARVGLETRANGEGGGLVQPAMLAFVDAIPGESFEASFVLANDAPAARTFTVRRLDEVEPDAEKHARYFTSGHTQVIKDTWLAPVQPLEVPATSRRTVTLNVRVPKTVNAGQRYEELVFIDDGKNGQEYLRLRIQVAQPTKP